MHLPVPKAGLIGLSALFALVAAFAVFMYSSGNTHEAHAATYSPSSAAKFCNDLATNFPSTKPYTDADLAGAGGACVEGAIPASTARDLTVTFTVGSGQSNFGSSVVTNTPGTVAADAAIPNGQKVGGLYSGVTLGLLNGNCATALDAEFVLYDSATTGSPIAVAAEGTADRFASIVDDAAPSPPGSTASDEVADSDSPFVTSNLDIYQSLFTPTGGSYIPPLARYTGATRVPAGGDWQALSFFQVSAGALDAFGTNGSDNPSILGRVSHSPTTGTLSLSILNDPTAVQISVSPIHDFCTPLVVQTMLLGTTPGGQTRYTTPSAGTAGISNYSYGQRDADNDGLENQVDTCPFNANSGTDSDGDGIDNACDVDGGSNPGGFGANLASGTDVDRDGYQNRQDNCPQYPNGGTNGSVSGDGPQVDSEAAATYLSAAPDGGPQTDGIGDECDPNPSTASTEGGFVEAYNLVVKCIGSTDADGDGYCAGQDLNDASACAPGGTKCGWTLNPGMDVEYKNGDSTIGDQGEALGGNQGGGNWERYYGTDPLKKCGAASRWPFDLVQSNTITISDVLALKPVFNSTVPPTDAHFDLVPSKSITISDVLALKPVFNKACTP